MRHLEETYSLLWSWLNGVDDDDNGDGDELELPSLAICDFFLWS